MEAKLAVYTVAEMMVTICRDLGILPDFDVWAAIATAPFTPPARPRRTIPHNPPRTPSPSGSPSPAPSG